MFSYLKLPHHRLPFYLYTLLNLILTHKTLSQKFERSVNYNFEETFNYACSSSWLEILLFIKPSHHYYISYEKTQKFLRERIFKLTLRQKSKDIGCPAQQ